MQKYRARTFPRKAKRPRTSAAKCRELLGQIRNVTYIVEGVEDADVLESVMTKFTECHRLLLQAAPKEDGVILEPQSSFRVATSKKKPRNKEPRLNEFTSTSQEEPVCRTCWRKGKHVKKMLQRNVA